MNLRFRCEYVSTVGYSASGVSVLMEGANESDLSDNINPAQIVSIYGEKSLLDEMDLDYVKQYIAKKEK